MSCSDGNGFLQSQNDAIDNVLKRKRKVRAITTCYPCRQRKVRCSGNIPCSTCVERDHTDLCFIPNSVPKRPRPDDEQSIRLANPSISPVPRSLSPARQDQSQPGLDSRALSKSLHTQPSFISNQEEATKSQNLVISDPPSTRTLNDLSIVDPLTSATIYLGSKSDPAFIFGLNADARYVLEEESLVSVGDSIYTTFPFANIWAPAVSMTQIYDTLPSDSDIMRLWRLYQDNYCLFHPILKSTEEFEMKLCEFLEVRFHNKGNVDLESKYDPSFIALIFAVLACGAQYCDNDARERDLSSKVLVCSAFQCLRTANFLAATNPNQIRALLLICHCLRNDMNINSAWNLMGLIVRLGQSCGLHKCSQPPRQINSSPEEHADKDQETKLWWMIVRQDTLLSASCDRPQSSIHMDCDIPYDYTPEEGRTFTDSMFTLCKVFIDYDQNGTGADASPSLVLACIAQLRAIFNDGKRHLRDRDQCRSLAQHLERQALTIHVEYAISRFCRNSLQYISEGSNESSTLLQICHESAEQVVYGYLDMHRLCAKLCRSWAFASNTATCVNILANATSQEVKFKGHVLAKKLMMTFKEDESSSQWWDSNGGLRVCSLHAHMYSFLSKICDLSASTGPAA